MSDIDNLFERKSRQSPELSLIPLINIIFLLLIFFLVAGTYSTVDRTIIDIPDAETSFEMEEGNFKKIEIMLSKTGAISFNDKDVTLKMLEKDIEFYLKKNPERNVVIKADQNLEALLLIKIMKMIAKFGGSNISIATEATK